MSNKEITEDEIDLIALVKSLWISRKIIFKITSLFLILGVIVALLSPVVYTASSTFIPQSNSSGGSSSLSGVASLVGINLGGNISGTDIPPSIYPQIIQGVPFKRELLAFNTSPEGSLPVTLEGFLLNSADNFNVISTIKKYTISLPFTILAAIKGENKEALPSSKSAINVSVKEEGLFEALDKIISLSVNKKDGFVTLSVTISDGSVAAYITKGAQEILQKTVIDYKIKSAKEILAFNKRELGLKKGEFDSLQNKLALFKDGNLNIIDSRFENELNKLESEFNIVSAVYQELNKQLEQSKLQVSKDTPIFSVIKPVTIPNKRSAPKRSLMVIMYGFIGFIVSCVLCLYFNQRAGFKYFKRN